MNRKVLLLAALATFLYTGLTAGEHVRYVNPFVGTAGFGNVYPGAQVPFGGIQISPDTDDYDYDVAAGYKYTKPTILGFSLTHLSGTGIPDLGDFLFVPGTGTLKPATGTDEDPDSGYRSRFSHDTESASPGYYTVELSDYGTKAEMTAALRSGILRFTYPASDSSFVMIDLNHTLRWKCVWSSVRLADDRTIVGSKLVNGWNKNRYVYFAARFQEPVKDLVILQDGAPVIYNTNRFRSSLEAWGTGLQACVRFKTKAGEQLTVKVAVSATGTDGALRNLAEVEGKDFDAVRAEAEALWEAELSRYELDPACTLEEKETFYTSVYRTALHPFVFQDADGRFRRHDGTIGTAEGFTNYTTFSLWDTYRAFHPLMNVLQPKRNADFVQSMLKHYEQSVHHALPVWSHMGNENWCMIGYHTVSVLADAVAKGTVKPTLEILEAMNSSATLPYYTNIPEYISLGYVPYDRNGSSASLTLEYAYDDWAIYQTALKLGNTKLAEIYKKRSQNWRNTFDTSIGFARPRYSDGTWKQPFSLLNTDNEGFIEGNSWNYSFYVPHDVEGLIEAMGGEEKFIANLDSIFVMKLPPEFFENTEDVTEEGLMGNYVHGNEPSHHIAYLYNWTSQPYKTQYWVREILNRMYKNNIDGLCGNDDCGQMSAWYIFSAMGFYPVCPGSDRYMLGAPYLPYMKVRLGNGKVLEIKAPDVSDENRYVSKVSLNGKEITNHYITHSKLMQGGVLEFEMINKN